MKDKHVERMKEIIRIANILNWINPPQGGYPLMQLSEVEKCMLAMVDDFELERMKDWENQTKDGTLVLDNNGNWQPRHYKELNKTLTIPQKGKDNE